MIKKILVAAMLTGGLAAGTVGIGAGTASADYMGWYSTYSECDYYGFHYNDFWNTNYSTYRCDPNPDGTWDLFEW